MSMIGKLRSFNSTPTIDTTVDVSFVIHDFKKSWNGQIITKEVCEENMHTLVNQPIVVKYNSTGDSSTDSFGDHAVAIGKNRDDGTDIIELKTTPVGVFTNAYIGVVDGEEVLVGEGKLWSDRFYNITSLLNQMLSEGIEVKCSCEYLFQNYIMEEGVQYPQTPISYTGHCILNSDPNRGVGVVLPAYDSSKVLSFNEAINADMVSINNKNKKEEGDCVSDLVKPNETEDVTVEPTVDPNVSLNDETEPTVTEPTIEPSDNTEDSLNTQEDQQENPELSTNDMSLMDERDKTIESLKNKITTAKNASENFWLSKWNIYNGYFVYEDYADGEWSYFKQSFSMGIEGEVILGDDVTKVKQEEIWTPVATYNQVLEEKVNLTNEVVALNAQIEELKEFKVKYDEVVFNEKLDEAMSVYESKFIAVNAIEKFEEESTKELVRETLIQEKSLNAKTQLADILLDCIEVTKTNTESSPQITELCGKKIGGLVPSKKRYSDYGLNI